MVNQDLFCDRVESRRILVGAVQALMQNERKLRQELRNIGETWRTAIASDNGDINNSLIAEMWGRNPENCPFGDENPVPADIPFSVEEAERMTPQEAMIYLRFLARHLPRRHLPIELLATTYVACAKQGQLTAAFASKIETVIESELGISVTLNTDSIVILFRHFGKDFDENTAPVCFKRWEEMLPTHALRLKLTIEQVIFSRLTVYKVIEEAMQTFTDFKWPLMNKLMPGELEKFRIAVNLIDGNPYYGFKKNIGEAASTRYKSLGWVSKELLIRGAGKGTLAKYAGWPRTIPNIERVRHSIDNYLHRRLEAAAIEEGDLTVCHAVMSKIIRDYNPAAYQVVWTDSFNMSGIKKNTVSRRTSRRDPVMETTITLPKSTSLGTLDSDENRQDFLRAAPVHTESDQLDVLSTSWQKPSSPEKTTSSVSPEEGRSMLDLMRTINSRLISVEEKLEDIQTTVKLLYKSSPSVPTVGPKTVVPRVVNWNT
jgi:hypothetical protein